MKGDVVIVDVHHRRAAKEIVGHLLVEARSRPRRTTLTVAGESGSGKSETAEALREELDSNGVPTAVLGQDDYFVLPPKSNDAARRRDIGWVGPAEVRLDLLDSHLAAARAGASEIVKPLVIYAEDTIVEETLTLDGIQAVIAEGTYTTLLEAVDTRIFIARNRLETMEARMRRGREKFDPFIEEVLKIEHAVISAHRARADIVITRDYEVEFATPGRR